MVGVTCCENDLLRVVLAVPLYLGKHLSAREINFVERDNVVPRITKFGHSLGSVVGHANREERV